MDKQLLNEFTMGLKFYKTVVCTLSDIRKKSLFDDDIMKCVESLAASNHNLTKEAKQIKDEIMDLTIKKEQAITSTNFIVLEIISLTQATLQVLNSENTQRLQFAVAIHFGESQKILPKFKTAIEDLKFPGEIMRVKEKLRVLVKVEKIVLKERIKAFGFNGIAIAGKFY